jgi:uncharacterized protein
MSTIRTVEELRALYGAPSEASLVKETPWITPHYRTFIETAPFVALATVAAEGLDCSPRGDEPGFVRVADERTLLMPDRRGNNRIDSLANILRDPRVALLFLIPGSGSTLRVNGRGTISIEPSLLDRFAIEGKAPRSVLVIEIDAVYFQCARAIMRSDLWNPAKHVAPGTLPSAGEILAALTDNRVGGEAYDRAWPQRARDSMW